MKTKQNLKLNMFNSVQLTLDSNIDIWAGVEKLDHAVAEFKENNRTLNELKAKHEEDLAPIIDQKADTRSLLIKAALPVLNIIHAFAYEREDKGTVKQLNYSKNKLTKSKDLELIEKCKQILKTGEKLFKKSINDKNEVDLKLKEKPYDILRYGLSEKMLSDLDAAEKAFIDAHLKLRDSIDEKKKYGRQITEVVNLNEKLLSKKIDLLVSIFESHDFEFYPSFKEARKIQKVEIQSEEIKDKKKVKKEKQADE